MKRYCWFLGLLILIFAGGCANKEAVTTGYEEPSFSLTFGPESYDSGDVYVSIDEYKGHPKIRVEIDDRERSLAGDESYLSLKALILDSSEWERFSSNDYFRGPWVGAPRDILTVSSHGRGLSFQGDAVPAIWKKRILALASSYR